VLDETTTRASARQDQDQDQGRDRDQDPQDQDQQQQQEQQHAAVDIDHARRETHAMRCKVLPILLRLAGDSNWQVRLLFVVCCLLPAGFFFAFLVSYAYSSLV